MEIFSAIEFDGPNSQIANACEIKFALVENGKIAQNSSYLFKSLKEDKSIQNTTNQIAGNEIDANLKFCDLFSKIKFLFKGTIVGSSMHSKQVLDALSDYYFLKLPFYYVDTSEVAKEKIPNLNNYKLNTIARHLNIPKDRGDNKANVSITLANIVLGLVDIDERHFKKSIFLLRNDYLGILRNIIAEGQLKYDNANVLLLWLGNHLELTEEHFEIFGALKNFCTDRYIDENEERILLRMIKIEIAKIEKMIT
jgi:hypothetical protein